jgi:hypothetical protein
MSEGPILYSFFGVGSGKLGPDTFTNASFVITIPTNTNRIYSDTIAYPQPTLRVTSPTMASVISIFGLWTAIFNFGLNLTRLNDALFVGMDVNRLFAVSNAMFANYGFYRAIGPVTGTPAFDPKAYPTTAGDLAFNAVSKGDFQATPATA